jgi:hypothetical protein
MRSDVGKLLTAAWELGSRHDRKWAVEEALMADSPAATRILEESLASDSMLLRQAASVRAGRTEQFRERLPRDMRKTLVGLSHDGQLRQDHANVSEELAELRRLPDSEGYRDGIAFLNAAPFADFVLVFTTFFLLQATESRGPWAPALGGAFVVAGLSVISLKLLRVGPTFSSLPLESNSGSRSTLLRRSVASSRRSGDAPGKPSADLEICGWTIRGMVLAALISIFKASAHPGFEAIAALAFLYAVCWAPSGLYCFVAGNPMAPHWWPAFPFIAGRPAAARLAGILRRVPPASLARATAAFFWRSAKALVKVFSALLLLFLGMAALGAIDLVPHIGYGLLVAELGSLVAILRYGMKRNDRRKNAVLDRIASDLRASPEPALALARVKTEKDLLDIVRRLCAESLPLTDEAARFFSDLSDYVESARASTRMLLREKSHLGPEAALFYVLFGSAEHWPDPLISFVARRRSHGLPDTLATPAGEAQLSPLIAAWLGAREAGRPSIGPGDISGRTLDQISLLVEKHRRQDS